MSLWFFFFFSSRRRHTRSLRDWSSDVCSSDLGGADEGGHVAGRDDLEGRALQGAHLDHLLQVVVEEVRLHVAGVDRKSTRLNSSHVESSYAVFCLKKKSKCQSREGQ